MSCYLIVKMTEEDTDVCFHEQAPRALILGYAPAMRARVYRNMVSPKRFMVLIHMSMSMAAQMFNLCFSNTLARN